MFIYNVLKASENEAQRQGLKLYAWLEYGLMLMEKDAIALLGYGFFIFCWEYRALGGL